MRLVHDTLEQPFFIETRYSDYGHLFDEFDPAEREPAEAVIKAARDQLVPRTYLSAAAE